MASAFQYRSFQKPGFQTGYTLPADETADVTIQPQNRTAYVYK